MSRAVVGVVIALMLLCGCAGAQREALPVTAAPDSTVEDVLRGMAERAGVVFLGTVVEVRRVPGGNGVGSGVVEVVFSVDRGLRGALTGRHFVLREWGGLWEGNDERYRVGERRLMLLHAPGAGGLSSPVGGMDGAILIRPGANATAEAQVDLRWVAARVTRGPVRYRPETPRIPRARPMAEVLHLPGEVTPVPETAQRFSLRPAEAKQQSSEVAEYAPVSSVMAAIARWGAVPR